MELFDILAKTTLMLEQPFFAAPGFVFTFQELLLWVATTVLVLVAGLLIFALLRLRIRTSADSVDQSNILLDTVWSLIPVAILILLILLTFQAVFWRGV